ncbi:MAG: hypothetical protein QM770_11860 [Tepidisphaeraceae bacterium]
MTRRIARVVRLMSACMFVATASGVALAETARPPRREPPQPYSIAQATSDQAQLHTIAFSGLAFVTGDFGASTFLPPGKVCDYFGFQYMRDIDAQHAGHNPKFLGRVAGNALKTLTDEQRHLLEALAREQAPKLNELAMARLPMIKAFHRQLAGDIPSGSTGLNEAAIAKHVGDLFILDAKLSYDRARVYGRIISTLTPEQKAYFARMKFGDFSTWPDVNGDAYRLPRGTEKMVNVAYMTYASEFFSWYAGSVEADTYFCPERHGTYFGGFYMKDMPAMGQRDFDISTSLTGDSGKSFLDLLTSEQRAELTSIPDRQRTALREIVDLRRSISTELRRFASGEQSDEKKVLDLGRRYGELDGTLSFYYASAFASVGQSMSDTQKAGALKLRNLDGYTSAGLPLFDTAAGIAGTRRHRSLLLRAKKSGSK